MKDGYAEAQSVSVQVPVTESIRVSVPMKIAAITQHIEVQANVSQLQEDSVTLGRVVDARSIQALPLASRNFIRLSTSPRAFRPV